MKSTEILKEQLNELPAWRHKLSARERNAREKSEPKKKIKNKQNRQGTFINYYLNIPLIFTFCQCVCVLSLRYIVVIVTA